MADNGTTFIRSSYTKREKHQSLGGYAPSTIYDTQFTTLLENPIYGTAPNYRVQNWEIIFNENSKNSRTVNNGNFIRPNAGNGGMGVNITGVNNKGAITSVSLSVIDASTANGYRVDDLFSIDVGGTGGSVRVTKVDGTGKITGVEIARSGSGYSITNNIPLESDDYWVLGELPLTESVQVEDNVDRKIVVDTSLRLKLDWTNLQNFALYGSLTELLESSIKNIISNFPASLWVVPKTGSFYNSLNNPFEIDLLTTVKLGEPDADNIRFFTNNYSRYDVVEANWEEYAYDCVENGRTHRNPTQYRRNKLSNCRWNLGEPVSSYRFVYIKHKPAFSGFTGTLRSQGFYNKTYTGTDNTAVIISNKNENVTVGGASIKIGDLMDGKNIVNSTQAAVSDEYEDGIRLLDKLTLNLTPKSGACSNISRIEFNFTYNDSQNDYCTITDIKSNVFTSGNNELTITDSNRPSRSFHIIPNQDYIDNFFSSLDDFEKTLLNFNSVPRYTSYLRLPVVNEENDVKYIQEKYTWKTPDGWNLDITSPNYTAFIERLLEASHYLDTVKCDNIYRMLTHESIKNMDRSLSRIDDPAKSIEYVLGLGKMTNMLRIFGRGYDEVKKYIKGVELMNNLSYNQLDNYPDALLRYRVDDEGWNASSLVTGDNRNSITDQLYHGWQEEYTAEKMDFEFYRRLLLNSPYIASWKGTKHGMEMIMNLFGVDRKTWEIEEYVYVATGTTFNNSTVRNSMFSNKVNITSPNIAPGYKYWVNAADGDDTSYIEYDTVKYFDGEYFIGVDGKPSFITSNSAAVYLDEIDNLGYHNLKRNYTINGDKWYDSGPFAQEYEPSTLDEDPLHDICVEKFYYGDYVQCDLCGPYKPAQNIGGGIVLQNGVRRVCPKCMGTGHVRNCMGVPAFKGNSYILYYQQNGGWYRETERSTGWVGTLDDLYIIPRNNLISGSVYYVVKDDIVNSTHYWIMVDIVEAGNSTGWHNILPNEMASYSFVDKYTNKTVTVSVDKLNEVVDTNDGNNPHSGGGKYDDGLEYVLNYGSLGATKGSLFKYVIDNAPDCIKSENQYKNLLNMGFALSRVVDTKKSWGVYDNNDMILHVDNNYSIKTQTPVGCGMWTEDNFNTRKVNYPKLPDIKYYQIINSKEIKLVYNDPSDYNRKVFIKSILPFIEEMIPSTTIIVDKDFLT
jgi:hypothetical protein